MNKYAVINLKTDPELKKLASRVADKLGISISAVLNNELKRFATEQSVTFEAPEVPNAATKRQMAASKKQIEKGDYHAFDSDEAALDFLHKSLQ